METSGRGKSEKAMIIIPGAVLLWAIVVVAGGPTHFLRMLNAELRDFATVIGGFVSSWF